MISKLFLKGMEQTETIENITKVEIKNLDYYRKLIYSPFDFISIYSDNSIIEYEKSSQIIYNHFIFNINEKKNINYLYKLMGQLLGDNEKILLNNVEESIFKLIDSLSYKIDFPIIYDERVDLSKILSSVNIQFDDNSNNYIESLVQYIKLNNYLSKTHYFICFGVTNMLTEEESQLVSKELESIDSYLIDFIYTNGDNKSDIIVDDEYCII